MTRVLMTADAVGGVWQYATELAHALAPLGVETTIAVLGPSAEGLARPDNIRSPAKAGAQGPDGSVRDPGLPPSRENTSPSAFPTSEPIPPGIAHGGHVDIIHTDLPLDWLAPGPADVARAGDAIAALARDLDADLVHLNSPALAARTRFPAPVVAVAHGCVASWWEAAHGTSPAPDYAWHAELMAQGLASADAVVAPSAAFAATIERLYDLRTTPLVVHNGRTAPEPTDAPQATGAFTAGRLWDPVKNTALLDGVAALLDAPFRAAGPLAGPHGERVAVAHLDHLGTLPDRDIAATLAARPIAVSAARFEPFGLSVLEAAAAGCPLVLSAIDTFRELWTGAALLVAEETPQAYADAITRIEADPALRRHLGEAARVRAQRYTPAAMAGAMAAIYAGLLSPFVRAAAA